MYYASVFYILEAFVHLLRANITFGFGHTPDGQIHASSIMDSFINAFASLTNCLIFAKLRKEGVSWKRVSCPLISMISAHAFTKRTRTPEITINVDAMGPGFLVL